MNDYQRQIQRLKDFGLEVTPGPKEKFGGAVTIKFKGESIDLGLHDAKAFSSWIMGVGQKVHNKLED